MWESTPGADLYTLSVFFKVCRFSGAAFKPVHWAIAKQAVDMFSSLMTGIINTIFIFKISVGIFAHDFYFVCFKILNDQQLIFLNVLYFIFLIIN